MSDIQTLTAECLSMQQGEKGSKNLSLNHRVQGIHAPKRPIRKIFKNRIRRKNAKDIRQAIKNERTTKTQENERNKNIGTNQGRTRK